MVPFRIEDVLPNKTLEYFISTQHWLDALTPPLEDHLHHLAETITVLLAKKGGKDKILPFGGGEPAPHRPPSHPEVTHPEESPPAIIGRRPAPEIPLAFGGCACRVLRTFSRRRRGLAILAAAAQAYGRQRHFPQPPPAETPAKLSANDYYNLGNEAKDPEEKIKNYTKAIEINPFNAQYYYYRGLAYNAKATLSAGHRRFYQGDHVSSQ